MYRTAIAIAVLALFGTLCFFAYSQTEAQQAAIAAADTTVSAPANPELAFYDAATQEGLIPTVGSFEQLRLVADQIMEGTASQVSVTTMVNTLMEQPVPASTTDRPRNWTQSEALAMIRVANVLYL